MVLDVGVDSNLYTCTMEDRGVSFVTIFMIETVIGSVEPWGFETWNQVGELLEFGVIEQLLDFLLCLLSSDELCFYVDGFFFVAHRI
mmetsp:Transcript_48544/g.90080  ORF Transcript_48544/g.90080 Transcript_48544/m.90080 type:complete len:87 (+) Transcript_48544:2083-2343(+)